MIRMRNFPILLVCLLITLSCQNNAFDDVDSSQDSGNEDLAICEEHEPFLFGEVIYVPIYSSIFFKNQKRTIELVATLSVHNTDLEKPIRLVPIRKRVSNCKERSKGAFSRAISVTLTC